MTTANRRASPFRLPAFYPVLDTKLLKAAELSAQEAANALLKAGVRILQYRHKDSWEQRHFDEAEHLAHLCEEAGVLFILNDRADYAKLLRCGLHIGQEDMPVKAVRELIGDEVLGFSTHNPAQTEAAGRMNVEYVSIGPVFDTSSKSNPDPVVGLDGIRKVRPLTTKPLCAIGGITLQNASSVLAAGANSVAILSGLFPPGKADISALRMRTLEWLAITGTIAARP